MKSLKIAVHVVAVLLLAVYACKKEDTNPVDNTSMQDSTLIADAGEDRAIIPDFERCRRPAGGDWDHSIT